MEQLKKVILIALSVFFLFGATALFRDYKIPALLFLVGAILLWPSVARWLAGITNKKWLSPALGIVLAVVIAPISFVATAPSAEEREAIDAQRAAQAAQRAEEKAIADAKKREENAIRDAARNAELREVQSQRMARDFVLGALKDPDSAQFRSQKGFCGEVNSKNSFGGYTGFKRFIASSSDFVAIEGDTISISEFQKAWGQVCNY